MSATENAASVDSHLAALGFEHEKQIYYFDASKLTLDSLVESLCSNQHGDREIRTVRMELQSGVATLIVNVFVRSLVQTYTPYKSEDTTEMRHYEHPEWMGEGWLLRSERFDPHPDALIRVRYYIEVDDPATGQLGDGQIQFIDAPPRF